MGFGKADGGQVLNSGRGSEPLAFGLPVSRKTTTPFEEGFGIGRVARLGGSAVQVKGFVGGVGRSALSGGGAGAYWLPSDAEHLAVGQGTNAGTLYRQVVTSWKKLELIGGKRVA